jgi:amphi-Trp domain-containing protein
VPEIVLFKSKEKKDRNEIAGFLRLLADKLEQGLEITLDKGDESVKLNPGANTELEIKVKDKIVKQQLAVKIKWPLGGAGEKTRII